MKGSTWDETCPKCGAKNDVYGTFQSKDYNTTFAFECAACGEWIACDVHMEPMFECFAESELKGTDRHWYGLPKDTSE